MTVRRVDACANSVRLHRLLQQQHLEPQAHAKVSALHVLSTAIAPTSTKLAALQQTIIGLRVCATTMVCALALAELARASHLLIRLPVQLDQ